MLRVLQTSLDEGKQRSYYPECLFKHPSQLTDSPSFNFYLTSTVFFLLLSQLTIKVVPLSVCEDNRIRKEDSNMNKNTKLLEELRCNKGTTDTDIGHKMCCGAPMAKKKKKTESDLMCCDTGGSSG